MRTVLRLTGVLMVAVLLLGSTASDSAEAASEAKRCLKEACKPQKKACLQGFKQVLKAAKADCDDKSCKRAVKRAFKAGKKACKKAFKPCKRCCKKGGVDCRVGVLGDGFCAGESVGPLEECDGADDGACPGQCLSTCVCPGSLLDPNGGVLLGQVSAIGGEPVPAVAVALPDGRSASTDDNGFFSFGDLTAGERVVVSFARTGFAPTSKSMVVGPRSDTRPGCVMMVPAAETVTIDADVGGEVRSGNSAVTITGGSLVDAAGDPVSGDVEVTATFVDPSTDAVEGFPGSFDDTQTSSGAAATLESFGFTVYELTQNGGPVNLAPGQTAEIEYVLPANSQNLFQVGDVIPRWHFDEATAMWMEIGQGTIANASDGSGRLAWFATVDQFSSWNCDAPIADKNCISGRVVVDGNPVAGAQIAAVGVTYNGTSSAQTAAEGTFCVDVKRDATVELRIRLNGSATPIATRTVTVPDASASCDTGGCTDVGDIAVTFDSCVTGRVTEPDGSPAVGVAVYVIPGERVTTAADGTYCARAPASSTVYVFAENRPSVQVTTPPSGSCEAGTCPNADLVLTLPGPGDNVGRLEAQKGLSIFVPATPLPGLDGTFESFSLSGSFLVFDLDDARGVSLPGLTVQVEDFGDCSVTTVIQDTSISAGGAGVDVSGIGALDPGNPGQATNGAAVVDLLKGEPTAQAPFLAGIYSPPPASDLLSLGFDAGQNITFTFPGGADIGSFSATTTVPVDLDVTSPPLSDPGFVLVPTSALNLAWTATDASQIVEALIFAADLSQLDAITFTGPITSVVIQCRFPDTGTAMVPQDLMARLPATPSSSTLSLSRVREAAVNVPLKRVSGDGVVRVFGKTSVSRTWSNLDLGGVP